MYRAHSASKTSCVGPRSTHKYCPTAASEARRSSRHWCRNLQRTAPVLGKPVSGRGLNQNGSRTNTCSTGSGSACASERAWLGVEFGVGLGLLVRVGL